MGDVNPYRLPRTVTPSRYELTLRPDLDGGVFSGDVVIEVDVAEATDVVVMNAAELDIASATVTQGASERAATVEFDEPDERVVLTLSEPLAAGAATIAMSFTGVLNDKLRGFYRSTYADPDTGDDRIIATTQFESTNARRAFPCFDEPDFKAVFAVTLEVDEGLTAVSCGPLVATEPTADGGVAHRFDDTMVMSTYLLAFIVGDLVATERVDVDGVTLRLLAVPPKRDLCEFGLEVAEFSLRWLSDYFGIRYPADKLDLVAIPDFAFGAMENMGCITFRETLLLADAQRTTAAEMSRIVDVVAHEIAHMWFGNLVTMDWWNGIWLKEAFATFMQMATTDAYRPEWRRWDEFSLERGAALDVDSLASTRPIEYEVTSPADAEGMYDLLTYEKGAAVVRMLEQFVTPQRFRGGVRSYLRRHSYGNVTTTDLWDALEASAGSVPVRAMADSWIFQGGYPLVSVAVGRDGGLVLTQKRFGYGSAPGGPTDAAAGGTSGGPTHAPAASAVTSGPLGERWSVPVILRAAVATGAGETQTVEHRVLLEEATTTVTLSELTSGGVPHDPSAGGASGDGAAGGERVEWVTANAGGHGYYRVRYEGELLAALVGQAFDTLEPIERYALVDDTYAAVLAGETMASDFLQLVVGLVNETDLRVWQRMIGGLAGLRHVATAEGRAALGQLIRDLAGTALGVLGREPLDGESDLDRELRATLVAAAGVQGRDEGLLGLAREWFSLTHDVHAAVEPGDAEGEARRAAALERYEPQLGMAAVSVVAALGGTDDDYETMLRLHREAETPQAQHSFLWALCHFDDPALFERTLTLARTEVRTQDAPYLLSSALSHSTLGGVAWQMMREHWDELCAKFPQNAIARMVSGVRALNTRELAEDVDAFLSAHPVPQGELIVAQHLEKMWVNVRLREREGAGLADAVRAL